MYIIVVYYVACCMFACQMQIKATYSLT